MDELWARNPVEIDEDPDSVWAEDFSEPDIAVNKIAAGAAGMAEPLE